MTTREGTVRGLVTTMPFPPWSAGFQARPDQVAHAKVLGSLATLCGENCLTWARLWESPFPAPGLASCPRCATAARL